MEWDGKVANPNFSCSVSGRTLLPGEQFFSGLVAAGPGFARRDFAPEAWTAQDPASFLSWWRQRVPEPDPKRRQVKLDKDLLLKLFTDLRNSRERPAQCLCYVIALCLVRAKAFVLASVTEAEGQPWLHLDHKADGIRLRLRDPRMTPTEQEQVQTALLDIIGFGEPSLPAQG
jgi:hypothetical protein